MSRTVLAKMDGFTPVIDAIVENTSLMSAVVFGRIWRFCQMKDGVCNASLDRIAQDIGIDKATAMRHAKFLVEMGYLDDMTPELRNHPHTYRDTGKASLQVGNAGVAECNAGVAESKLKIDIKKNINIESTTAEIFTTYSNEIAPITPNIADKIGLWIDDPTIPNSWITDAIKEASSQNKRNWAYCEAILKRWSIDGKTPKKPEGRKNSRQEQIKKLRQL